jgi:antitoxin HicB
MKKKNIGSFFDSWLRKEGIYEEVRAKAIKRVAARTQVSAPQSSGPNPKARDRSLIVTP